MNHKEIIEYKKSVFSRIKDAILALFKKNKNSENIDKKKFAYVEKSDNLLSDLALDEIKEKERIIHLKLLYDNGQLTEENISDEDADKIVKLYEEETKILQEDTKRRLKNIENIINKND